MKDTAVTVDLEKLSAGRSREHEDLPNLLSETPCCSCGHDAPPADADAPLSEHLACPCACSGDEHEEPTFWDGVVLALGGAVLISGLFLSHTFSPLQGRIFYGVPWLLCGWPILSRALDSVRRGRFFNEFTLMGGASFAAVCLGEVSEALAVMILYQTGELLQERAAGRSRGSIRALLAVKPTVAHVVEPGGTRDEPPERVEKGMTVLVKPGEKIPVDGFVTEGSARVDTSPITGESVPVSASAGVKVYGGTLCLDGALKVEASGPFKNSEIARVLQMVERAVANKSPVERFITKFAALYTPAVFGVALLTFAVPPLLGWGPAREWLYRALVVLMVSCPCALAISIPLSYFGGIGAAARWGILIKGGTVLDALNEVSSVGFDKTGTLTEGVFEVTELQPAPGVEPEELRRAARIAEALSEHPLARSIRSALGPLPPDGIETKEHAGRGVVAHFEGERYLAGSVRLLTENGVSASAEGAVAECAERPGVVCVARGQKFLGTLTVSDRIKEDAADAVAQLRRRGLKSYLLTGDREPNARLVAQSLSLDGYRAELLPEMKVHALADLARGEKTAFVGDGVNDAPLLASAHVGVAMGGLGSDVAIEAADAVVLNDAPSRVVKLMDVARRTRAIVRQNLVGSLATKAVFLGLGFFGLIGLWEAIFADVGVALLAVLNSARQLKG